MDAWARQVRGAVTDAKAPPKLQTLAELIVSPWLSHYHPAQQHQDDHWTTKGAFQTIIQAYILLWILSFICYTYFTVRYMYSTSSTVLTLPPLFSGCESQHDSSVPAGSVQLLLKTHRLQEAPLLPLLLSQHPAGKEKVFTAGLEHCLWLQRFWLWGQGHSCYWWQHW